MDSDTLVGFSVVYLMVALVLSLAAGTVAEGKGRSFRAYFFLGLLLTPLIGLAAALLATPTTDNRIAAGLLRRCPHCAEAVQPAAKVCRFCGRDLPRPDPPRRCPECSWILPADWADCSELTCPMCHVALEVIDRDPVSSRPHPAYGRA